MGQTTKKQVKVLEAKYVKEADSILIVGECKEGKLQHQIHSSCFTFGNKNKEEEMSKTASMMVNKTIWMVFDEDLDKKLNSNKPLSY